VQTSVEGAATKPVLGFPRLATAIAEVVQSAASKPEAAAGRGPDPAPDLDWLSAAEARLTIGVFAPWGAGKSTLINALRAEFRRRGHRLYAFNPWKWDGKGDLHDHVREVVLDQTSKAGGAFWLLLRLRWLQVYRIHGARLWWTLVAIVALILAGPQMWSVLGSLFGPNAQAGAADVLRGLGLTALVPLAGVLLQFLQRVFVSPLVASFEKRFLTALPAKLGADGLSSTYADVARLSARRGALFKPFVFFIDDLDRCAPERVAMVLESVHSLTAAGCVVFIACDEQYVVAALDAHYERISRAYPGRPSFGERYLEKIVQIVVRLPLLRGEGVYELGLAKRPVALPEGNAGILNPVVQGGGAPATADPMIGDRQRAAPAIDTARLSEIAGELLAMAVEPLGLNVRQAKAINNAMKLYLRVAGTTDENAARRVAAFVLAERLNPDWLDARVGGAPAPSGSRIAAATVLARRLGEMLGEDRGVLDPLFNLLGRQPRPVG